MGDRVKITAFDPEHSFLLGTGITLGSPMTAGDPTFFLLNGSNLNGSNLRPAAGDVIPGTLYPDASLSIIYQSDGTTWNVWADLANGGMTNPMSAQDDLIIGGAAGAPSRLGKGSDGQVLTVDPTTHHLLWAAAGGGGGSDLVQTYSGGGSVYIPGLIGSPDRLPASPSASDDEFGALSGWTTLGTLDTLNVTDFPSHVHIGRTAGSWRCDGLYKSAPSMPYTVTAKLSDTSVAGNYQFAGIFVGVASPGKMLIWGQYWEGGRGLSRQLWTNPTTRASYAAISSGWPPLYLRMVVTSSTDVVCQYSYTGFLWTTGYATLDPAMTLASVGFVVNDYYGALVGAVFDWIRFT